MNRQQLSFRGNRQGFPPRHPDRTSQALLELGTRDDPETGMAIPLSRPTDGMRASAEFLATFFSGALAIGVTRPLDESRKWKFTWRVGQGF